MPEEAPVTIAHLPLRSIPATTSAAVESNPKGVVMRGSRWMRAIVAVPGGSSNHENA
jgi:hypothetical protein